MSARPIRGVVFLNPSSGWGKAGGASAFQEAARQEGLDIQTIHPGLKIRTIITERATRGQKLFVAAGGDGTISHVAQGLIGTDATLGIIPLGTFNHFARDLGIPLDWRQALEIAVRGTTKQVDVAQVNERIFINNLSLGIYPPFVDHREKLRHYGRWRALPMATYHAFRHFPHVALAIETPHRLDAVKTHVFMVSNNPYDLSQFGLDAPRPSIETGTLGVYWIEHMAKLQFARVLAHYFRGKPSDAGGFQSLRTTQLRVQSAEKWLKLGLDGEIFTMRPPLVIHVVPRALLVKTPR